MGLKAEVAGRRRRLKAFSAGRGFEWGPQPTTVLS
jgi:hypothetical protein